MMRINRIISAVAVLVIFLRCVLTPVPVMALETGKGKITIEGSQAGMKWSIFRVAEAGADGKLKPDIRYSEFNIPDFFDFIEEIQSLAYTFENYIKLMKSEPVSSGFADSDGKISFSGLEYGWYTAVPEKLFSGNMVYTASPIMICISDYGIYSKAWGTSVTVRPKTDESVREPSKDIIIKYYPNSSSPDPDKKIPIIIYHDNEKYDSALLEKDNDWTYVIPGVPDDDTDWKIVQTDVPDNEYPVYHKETNRDDDTPVDILIIWHANIPDTPVTEPDNTETQNTDFFTENSEKLPQTGQLWWPVPVLASAGILFIAAGISVRRKDGKK